MLWEWGWAWFLGYWLWYWVGYGKGVALAIIYAWWYRAMGYGLWVDMVIGGYERGISNANGFSMVNALCII